MVLDAKIGTQRLTCYALGAELFAGVIAVARLDGEILPTGGEVDLVVSVCGGCLVWGVAETVLGTELFGDLSVDLGYGLLLRDFKEASSCLLRHALEDLLAVDSVRSASASGTTAWTATAATGVASSTAGVTSATTAGEAYAAALTSAATLPVVI